MVGTGHISAKMAPKTIKMAILAALEDLVDADLEKFCSQLLDHKGKRVRTSWVMGKSRVHISSVLIQTYTEKGALKVVLETLRDAGFEQRAKKFEKATRNFTKTKRKTKARGALGAAASGPVLISDPEDEMDSSEDSSVSFIRDHKMDLITCLGADLFILQLAQQNKVITDTEYRKIKSITSKDDAVTELIDVVMHKGPVRCRPFLQILKEPKVVETYPLLKEIMKDWK